jgi:hypothetical protein
MPVLNDFAVTYQWVRELRRWHRHRLLAVSFVLADDQPVLVGRYGQTHQRVLAAEAAPWVQASSLGAQVVVPRSVTRREISTIRELTQLVGWSEAPEPHLKSSCVCPGCLPAGAPDFLRKLRRAYRDAIQVLRQATTVDEAADALGQMEVPLERAKGRLSPKPLLTISRSEHPCLRAASAGLLALFKWKDVQSALSVLADDAHCTVRQWAVNGIWTNLGSLAAAEYLVDRRASLELVSMLEWEQDEGVQKAALDLLEGSEVPGVSEAARALRDRLPVTSF